MGSFPRPGGVPAAGTPGMFAVQISPNHGLQWRFGSGAPTPQYQYWGTVMAPTMMPRAPAPQGAMAPYMNMVGAPPAMMQLQQVPQMVPVPQMMLAANGESTARPGDPARPAR